VKTWHRCAHCAQCSASTKKIVELEDTVLALRSRLFLTEFEEIHEREPIGKDGEEQ
jgi:hypothetical protein